MYCETLLHFIIYLLGLFAKLLMYPLRLCITKRPVTPSNATAPAVERPQTATPDFTPRSQVESQLPTVVVTKGTTTAEADYYPELNRIPLHHI